MCLFYSSKNLHYEYTVVHKLLTLFLLSSVNMFVRMRYDHYKDNDPHVNKQINT